MTALADSITVPVVSVIVPVYNGESHIEATLASIRAQTLRQIEVLVVDDCSRDGTADAVRRVAAEDSRVRYLVTPSNFGGPAGPRNVGLAQARADWVAFCDADDLWDPLKLEVQLESALAHGFDLLCTRMADFDDGTHPARAPLQRPAAHEPYELTLTQMLFKNRIGTSSVLCRRDVALRAGGFDPDRRLVAVEDYDLWLRMLDAVGARLARLDIALVDYRVVPTSLSRSKLMMARKIARVLRRHFQRRGQAWLFPLAAPLLMTAYAGAWLWTRARGRKM